MAKRPLLAVSLWLWIAVWASIGLLWIAGVALPPDRLESLYYGLFGIWIVFGGPLFAVSWGPAAAVMDYTVAATAFLAGYFLAAESRAKKCWRHASLAVAGLWASAFVFAFYLGLDYTGPGHGAEHLLLGGTIPFAALGLGFALLRRLSRRQLAIERAGTGKIREIPEIPGTPY